MPEHQWLEWKFEPAPHHFWEDRVNRTRYLKWLLEILGFKRQDEYYRLKVEDFRQNYGAGLLLRYYNDSPAATLRDCFPEHEWVEFKFNYVEDHYWDSEENRISYLDWLGQRLGFSHPNDWYCLTAEDVKRNYGGGLISYYDGSSKKLVMAHIRNVEGWRPEFDKRPLVKREKHLYMIISRIFPGRVEYNYHHPDLRFSCSGRKMQFDVFVKPYLAIEYQSDIHFRARAHLGGIEGLEERQSRDAEKKAACKAAGIALIEITHKWDGSLEEVLGILKRSGIKSAKAF